MWVSFVHSFSCESYAYLIISSKLLALLEAPIYIFWDAYNVPYGGIYTRFPWEVVTSECQDLMTIYQNACQFLSLHVLNS